MGSAVYASDGTVVLFQNKVWIGCGSANGSDGFNFFGLDDVYLGYFIPLGTGKHIGFDIDGDWILHLQNSC